MSRMGVKKAGRRITEVPLTKQKVAKGQGNSLQEKALGRKKLATVKPTTKKNQTLGKTVSNKNVRAARQSGRAHIKAETRIAKVTLAKQKVAKGLGNSFQRKAPGKKKLATVKSTTKKNQPSTKAPGTKKRATVRPTTKKTSTLGKTVSNKNARAARQSGRAHTKAEARITKVPLAKQKAAQTVSNKNIRAAPQSGRAQVKAKSLGGQQKVGKKVQRKVRMKANVNIADNTKWRSDLYNPLHLQNPHRHDEIDIVIIEKDYHSGGKYIRQLEPIGGKTIDFLYENSHGHVFYQKYLPGPRMNVYYNRETGKRVTTWPQSGKRRVEMLKPDIHLYKTTRSGKKYYCD